MHAASCLPVVSGAWQYEGGGALYNQGDLYHWDKTDIEGLDLIDPSIRNLDQSRIGPILIGDRQDLGDGPPVTALIIQNTNPMCVAPELDKVHEGFARDDLFVCVHEQFMTETAKIADIVLPATQFLEHDDIYQASGHTRIQIARKLFEPYAECRTNHDVICALAERLGADAPGLRHDRMAADRRPARALRLARCRDDLAGGRLRRDAGLRHLASPERLSHAIRKIPVQAGLGEVRPGPRAHAEAAGSLRDHRRGGRRAPVPARGGAGAQLPQHQLHRDPDLDPQGGAADRADPSRGRQAARHRSGRSGAPRQRPRLGAPARRDPRRASSRASWWSRASGRTPPSTRASGSTP